MQALETIGGLLAAVAFVVVVAALVATPQAKVSKRLDEGEDTIKATWVVFSSLALVPVAVFVLILVL